MRSNKTRSCRIIIKHTAINWILSTVANTNTYVQNLATQNQKSVFMFTNDFIAKQNRGKHQIIGLRNFCCRLSVRTRIDRSPHGSFVQNNIKANSDWEIFCFSILII